MKYTKDNIWGVKFHCYGDGSGILYTITKNLNGTPRVEWPGGGSNDYSIQVIIDHFDKEDWFPFVEELNYEIY